VSGPPPATPLGRRELLLWALVLLFAAGLFTFRLGAGSLWDVDEPRYAEISREILATRDPITMHLDGRPWYGRPPLWMWLQAGTGAVFGFGESTVRAWAAVFGVAGVAAAMALGREWFGPRTGILSGLILGTMLEYLFLSRLAVLDVVQLAWTLLALHAFYCGYRDHARAHYLRAFLYAGLATLTGGPIALVLLGLVFWIFMAYRRALRRWREVPWVLGGLICLGIASPWYVAEWLRAGPAFLRLAVGDPGSVHLPSAIVQHAATAFYHLPVLALGAIPWTAFLPGALVYHYIRRWQDGSLMTLIWCAAAFGVAVALGHTLPDEVFPVYPLAAIAIARLWEEFLFEGGSMLRRTLATSYLLQIGVVFLLIAAPAAFATARYPQAWDAVRGALVPPLAALVLGMAATAALFRTRRYTSAFLALPATMAVFAGVLYTVTVPVVETQKPMKPIAWRIAQELRPHDRVVGYGIGPLASLVYYTNHPVAWVEDPTSLRRSLCAPGRVFVVTTRDQIDDPQVDASPFSRDAAAFPNGDGAAHPPARRDAALWGLQTIEARGRWLLLLKPEALTCGGRRNPDVRGTHPVASR
jgi:4-amino-4-deoxy-L-arabinose transferase-like glycosyltransferase